MAKKKFKKECKNCGKKFTAMNVRKIFCMRKCAELYHARKRHVPKIKMKKTCFDCGKKFRTENKAKEYCSDKCWQRQSRKKEFRVEKTCLMCSSKFHSGKKTAKFCSPSCSAKYSANFGIKEDSTCKMCKISFKRRRGWRQIFCSRKCKNKNRKTESAECSLCKKRFKRRSDSIKKDKKIFCSVKCKISSQGASMTSPHRKTVEILRKNRIWNRSEHKVERYLLDCYLGKGLAIEVQGGYWHGDIRLYRASINGIQRRADKRDRRKKDFLHEQGITVLYIWEDDIENDPEMCEKLILKFKERNGILSNYHSMNYHTRGRSVALNRDILVPRFEL